MAQARHVLAGRAGRVHPKTDHSGAAQNQEQRYRKDGILNTYTPLQPYDLLLLTTLSGGEINKALSWLDG